MNSSYAHYETTFILTPVLSDEQVQSAIEEVVELFNTHQVKPTAHEQIGLQELAYPIKRHRTGNYQVFRFAAPPSFLGTLATFYRREEHIIRFLTVKIGQEGIHYHQEAEKKAQAAEKQDNHTVA